MTLIITVCAVMAVFSLLMFLFGINNFVKTKNKVIYRLSLSILALAIVWIALGVFGYFNYIQQINL